MGTDAFDFLAFIRPGFFSVIEPAAYGSDNISDFAALSSFSQSSLGAVCAERMLSTILLCGDPSGFVVPVR